MKQAIKNVLYNISFVVSERKWGLSVAAVCVSILSVGGMLAKAVL